MTEPASLPFFVGVDLASSDGDRNAWVLGHWQLDGSVKIVAQGNGNPPPVIDLPRDQWSETK